MSKLGDKRRAELGGLINKTYSGGSEIGNQRREEMYEIVNHSNGHTDLGNQRRAELENLALQMEFNAKENEAKKSPISFDESGEVNPGQTMLNFKSYMDGFKKNWASDSENKKKYEHSNKRERNEELALWEAHGGKTMSLFGKTYGIGKVDEDYNDEYKVLLEKQKERRRQEGVSRYTDSQGIFSPLPAPSEMGMPKPEDIKLRGESAKYLAEHYGVGTAQLIGSDTRKNIEAMEQKYSDMGYGQKLIENPKLTGENYVLDLISAGLTAADALTLGKLGEGELGTASSIFNVADFLQSGSSEILGMSYGTMRESSSWLGRLILDLERTGIEQIMDRVIGKGNGLIPMGLRVFGSGAQEAQSKGKGLGDQVKTGLIRGGIEVGTELLGGVGGSWRGTGYGDAVFSSLDKWIPDCGIFWTASRAS